MHVNLSSVNLYKANNLGFKYYVLGERLNLMDNERYSQLVVSWYLNSRENEISLMSYTFK